MARLLVSERAIIVLRTTREPSFLANFTFSCPYAAVSPPHPSGPHITDPVHESEHAFDTTLVPLAGARDQLFACACPHKRNVQGRARARTHALRFTHPPTHSLTYPLHHSYTHAHAPVWRRLFPTIAPAKKFSPPYFSLASSFSNAYGSSVAALSKKAFHSHGVSVGIACESVQAS